MLVDGVTKLDKLKYGDTAQAETVRKMVVAMSKDIRVLVIKLADRLHNARTWGFVPAESAQRKAQGDARDLRAARAPARHPDDQARARGPLVRGAATRSSTSRSRTSSTRARRSARSSSPRSSTALTEDLKAAKIRGQVVGRPKQYYSIYQKMIVRGREFDEIYDLVGIRVLVDSVRDCYAVLGAIHARWTPMPGRFKDYIATPKFNLYQSLHTTVIGPRGPPRSRSRSARTRCTSGPSSASPRTGSTRSRAAGRATDVVAATRTWRGSRTSPTGRSETTDPRSSSRSLRFEIGAKEVYVFTPKGKVIGLPAGATPVDFAYAVHTEVGHRTMGAKVNGRLVPLDTRARHRRRRRGVHLEEPGLRARARTGWQFVRSPRARSKIRQWFRRSAATRRSSRARTRSRGRCASRTCRCRSS